MKAWLHRERGPAWGFGPIEGRSPRCLYHDTGKNLYAILSGLEAGKPFWIGRLVDGSWVTYEREVGASWILFEGVGGECAYEFPSPSHDNCEVEGA